MYRLISRMTLLASRGVKAGFFFRTEVPLTGNHLFISSEGTICRSLCAPLQPPAMQSGPSRAGGEGFEGLLNRGFVVPQPSRPSIRATTITP